MKQDDNGNITGGIGVWMDGQETLSPWAEGGGGIVRLTVYKFKLGPIKRVWPAAHQNHPLPRVPWMSSTPFAFQAAPQKAHRQIDEQKQTRA